MTPLVFEVFHLKLPNLENIGCLMFLEIAFFKPRFDGRQAL
jgi:hypothetical protein